MLLILMMMILLPGGGFLLLLLVSLWLVLRLVFEAFGMAGFASERKE